MINYCKCPKTLIAVDSLHISHAKSTKNYTRAIYTYHLHGKWQCALYKKGTPQIRRLQMFTSSMYTYVYFKQRCGDADTYLPL